MGMLIDGEWTEDDGPLNQGGKFLRPNSIFRNWVTPARCSSGRAPSICGSAARLAVLRCRGNELAAKYACHAQTRAL